MLFPPRVRVVHLFTLALFLVVLTPTLGLADEDTVTPTPTTTPTATATSTPCSDQTRYWVGGAGNADDPAHWSCSSGGEGGASVPACITAGDTSQGANDCVWDSGSGLGEPFSDLFSTGLCCRNVTWEGVDPLLNTSNPENPYYEPRARFTDGFIVSGGIAMSGGIGFHWGAGRLRMTATSGTHDLLITELPVGGQTDGGIDFHGSGTYGDSAIWNLTEMGGFDGRIGYAAHNITFGYGTLRMNGIRMEGWDFRSGHGSDPADSFTFEAGSATPNHTWPQNNSINAWHSWSPDSNFDAGTSSVWCGGVGSTWGSGTCTFNGGGLTYYDVAAALVPGREYIVNGNATVTHRLRVFTQECDSWTQCAENPAAPVMTIEAGSTQTVEMWDTRGRSETALTLRSSETGQPWTLHCTGYACGGDYLEVRDSICTGTTPCYAGTHSTVDTFSLAHGWVVQELPPTPGCCAFTGNNMLGATCVDSSFFMFDGEDLSVDYCQALQQAMLPFDEVLYYNPDVSCAPGAGSFQGYCPPLDPTTPTPTPVPSGCCVMDSECSLPPEANLEFVPVSGGLCMDTTILGGQILSDARCSAGAAMMGCTRIRFVEGGSCASDCAAPTATPTPTATQTPTPTATCGEARYWVGGTGSADDPAHWSCVSGGSGGAPLPACVEANDTYQGTNDCIWDGGSGLDEGFADLFSTGLCCRTADWTAVSGILNESNPEYSYYEARARFTDGFIISGSLKMNWGIGFHWGAGPVTMTANEGEHDLVMTTDIPVGGQVEGGINFHGTGTYGDDATWNLLGIDTFNGNAGYAAQNIILGYGTLQTNGWRIDAWEIRNGHEGDPQDSFTLDAGTAENEWANVFNAGHLWSIGSNFSPGNSTVWCGGVGGTWSFEPCTFDGGGATYHKAAASVRAGNEYIVNGNATIGRWDVFTHYCEPWQCDPESETPAPATMTIEAGSTQTVADWFVAGGDGRPLVIRSSETGESWTLNCTDSVCQSDYIVLSDSICTGNTPCYAGDHSIVDEFSLAHGWAMGNPPPPTGCCQFAGHNMLGATCVDTQFFGGVPEISESYCEQLGAQFLQGDAVQWYNPNASCNPSGGNFQGYCPPLNEATPTPAPPATGCCVMDSECSLPPDANLAFTPVTGGLCLDSTALGGQILSEARCNAGQTMLGCTKIRFIESGTCDTDCSGPVTPSPTPTPTVPPGCCQFTGDNMLGATCVDRGAFFNDAAISMDYCEALAAQFFHSDQVLWFNPNATCDPAPGSFQGVCPPLDPSTPTPTPLVSGCCVLDSECSIPPEAGFEPVPVSGGLCADSSALGGQVLNEGRCNAGATLLGCTKVRFIAGGECASDCGTPTPTATATETETPTETPTATETPTPHSCTETTRYWVGGSGNANEPAHWSCDSGGDGFASVPECVEAGDTYQGTTDCVWDQNSGLPDGAFLWTTGLCCNNATWADVPRVLETNTPGEPYWRSRALFSDGFFISGSVTMGFGIGFDWWGSALKMTADSGTHDLLITDLPVGDFVNGGIDFHGTGTYGDDATWSLQAIGGFDGRIGWGHNVTFGYGTLQMNGLALAGYDFRSGHEGDPADSFTFDAGSAEPYNGWPPNNVINIMHSWSIGDTTFDPGASTVWCGGVNGTWGHGTCTFDGGDLTYFNVAAAVSPGRQYIIQGNASITNVLRVFTHECRADWQQPCDPQVDAGATMLLAAGSTQTVAGWNVTGNATERLAVGSTTPGQPWTLNCTAPHCISDYIDLTDSICTGNIPCYAGTHSTADQFSLDHGWTLAAPPTATPTATWTPSPTTTPRPNDCSVGDNMCNLDDRAGCRECISLHIPDLVGRCVAETQCTNRNGCQDGGSCLFEPDCAAAFVESCAAECRCLATATPAVSPTPTTAPPPPVTPSFVEFESGQVRPLALSPDGERLFAVNTPDDRLEVFNIGEGGALSHIASVPVGLEPVAVAARSNDEVWVVNHLSDSISIVNLANLEATPPLESTPPRVTRTLLVGDEPRDIVFAGPQRERAFITTAHRGQNDSTNPALELLEEGVGRADVWVFDATDLGDALAGTPLTKIVLFSDTPRALATSADGSTVYAAAFHSGNRTTSISAGLTTTFAPGAVIEDCTQQQQPIPACLVNELPLPQQPNQPFTALIVKQRNGSDWVDRACDGGPRANQFCTTDADCTLDENAYVCGRNWNTAVMFNLPDQDVFAIDANFDLQVAPVQIEAYAGVGTILFNMAVHPTSGKVYVTNTDANNDVRFEGNLDLNDPGDSSVRGNMHKSRVTVIDGSNVLPRHLNKHIVYSPPPGPTPAALMRAKSLAQPTGIVLGDGGDTAYIAALGSDKIGVFETSELDDDSFEPNADDQIPVSGGGPTGLVLDEGRHRLYVMTRFDNGISSIDTNSKQEIDHYTLHNPEPATVTTGRRFFYDATFSSANGESSCASCHVFGDFDSLAWDLGDPDGAVAENLNPLVPLVGAAPDFHPMKGPMTTQTLRGLRDHGAMHWRGDRSGAGEAADPFDAFAAFMKFRGAFESLLGRDTPVSTDDMEAFTRFILEVTLPPNPIRNLDNSLTGEQQTGANFFFGNRSDAGSIRCDSCHTIDPSRNMFGTNRGSILVGTQAFKIPGFRNLYQKVGMFGQAQLITPAEGVMFNTFDSQSTGNQVRGFGYMHDGSIDDLVRFVNVVAFNESPEQPEGFHVGAEGDDERRGVALYMLAADTNLKPVVGQQVTLTADPTTSVTDRLALLIARCGTNSDCDLVVKGTIDGQQRGWVLERDSGEFRSDLSSEELLSDGELRELAEVNGQELTYTAVPPGSGRRIGIDRDLDTYLDADEVAGSSDPANPLSTP